MASRNELGACRCRSLIVDGARRHRLRRLPDPHGVLTIFCLLRFEAYDFGLSRRLPGAYLHSAYIIVGQIIKRAVPGRGRKKSRMSREFRLTRQSVWQRLANGECTKEKAL
jgi:hypothetical protein